jgi:hypothetical protein
MDHEQSQNGPEKVNLSQERSFTGISKQPFIMHRSTQHEFHPDRRIHVNIENVSTKDPKDFFDTFPINLPIARN